MRFDPEKYVALVEERLSLVRLLAAQLVQCRQDFVSMNLDRMYTRIAEQESTCRRIEALAPLIGALEQLSLRDHGLDSLALARHNEGAAWAGRLGQLTQECEEAQSDVARLSQVHTAYLRRSRKTIEVLLNSLGMHAMTYSQRAETTAIPGPTSEKG